MHDAARHVLLSMAVGDALGLPWENLPPERIDAERQGWPTLLDRGVVSDDTEHAYLTYRAWCEADGDLEAFRQGLARRLRRWFLALPPGIGLGTARALAKLCLGWSPARSGSSSAGNGTVMRAPVLGVLVPEAQLPAWVEASSVITHRDPRAIEGALVVARLARATRAGRNRAEALRELLPDVQGPLLRDRLEATLEARGPTVALAAQLGLAAGVTGFVDDTVPVVVHLWLRHHDVGACAREAVALGGDTDTVAAIAAGLVGAAGIGPDAGDRHRLVDAPLNHTTLADGEHEPAWARSLLRNLGLLPPILWHLATRRLGAR